MHIYEREMEQATRVGFSNLAGNVRGLNNRQSSCRDRVIPVADLVLYSWEAPRRAAPSLVPPLVLAGWGCRCVMKMDGPTVLLSLCPDVCKGIDRP